MDDVQLRAPLLQMAPILAGGRATKTNVFVWREAQANRATFLDMKWWCKSDESHVASSQHAYEYVHFAGWCQCFYWVFEILAWALATFCPILKVKGNQPTSFQVLLRLGTFCLPSIRHIRPCKEIQIGGSDSEGTCMQPTMELRFEYKPRVLEPCWDSGQTTMSNSCWERKMVGWCQMSFFKHVCKLVRYVGKCCQQSLG